MAADTYRVQYNATINTDDICVIFHRLFTDVRDVMSDCLKPDWMPLDKFIITLTKQKTTYHRERLTCGTMEWTSVEVLDKYEIRTDSKQAANYIWYLAKNGIAFDTIVAMDKANKF